MTGFRACLAVVGVALLAGEGPIQAQTGNLIEREIDQALEGTLWRVGPFRLTPQLRLGGGYDDNALSSAFAPVSDVTFSAAPGLRAVTPLGRRGLITLYEELDFVYFRDVVELRDVFDLTRVGVAFGGKRLVLRLEDELRRSKARPTTEFDVPVDQETNHLDASLSLALGWRHELTLGYQNLRTRLAEGQAAVDALPVGTRLNRDQEVYRLRFSRYVTARTTFLLEASREKFSFEKPLALGEPAGYGAQGGFAFSPKGRVRGQALLGFKAITPDPSEIPEFRGLVAAVDAQMRLGRRMGLGALFSRNLQPSVLADNWFFVETRYGGSASLYFTPSFYVSPALSWGRNTYPRPVRIMDEQGQLQEIPVLDRFGQYSLSFNYLIRGFRLTLAGTYVTRDSDLRAFQKDRFVVNLGLSREL
jgi:hypothetical protein